MQLDPALVIPLHQWALPKLRALVDARSQDAVAGTGCANFQRLLNYLMSEYGRQSFAHAHPRSSDALQKYAEDYLRSQSGLDDHPHLAAYEAAGHASEDSPFDLCTALELWAGTEQPHIRALACIELGIPADATNTELTADYAWVRRAIIKREFGELSEAEQDAWRELAAARKQAVARGETDVIAVQDAQESIAREVYEILSDKFAGSAVGETLIFTWQGCYAGAEDKGLRRFYGQISTLEQCPQWIETSGFNKYARPAWKGFAYNVLNDLIVNELAEYPADLSVADVRGFRKKLQFFCEELFRLQARHARLDRAGFWRLVARRPYEFVAPRRLPAGIQFGDPMLMVESDFWTLYKHIWLSQKHREDVRPELRFAYQPAVINLFISMGVAQALKADLAAKKMNGDGAASGEAGSAVPIPASAADHGGAHNESSTNAAVLDGTVLHVGAANAGNAAAIPGAAIAANAAAILVGPFLDAGAVFTEAPDSSKAADSDVGAAVGPLAPSLTCIPVDGRPSPLILRAWGTGDAANAPVDDGCPNGANVDNAGHAIPRAVRDQQNKRCNSDSVEKCSKAAKRYYDEDATTSRTDSK